eukprot:EG_transcript_4727
MRRLWETSSYIRSLSELFHFSDAALEQRYRQRSQGHHLLLARVHFGGRLALTLLQLGSYSPSIAGGPPQPFWVYTFVSCLSTMCLVLALAARSVQRRILPVHCVFCCLYMVANTYVAVLQVDTWAADSYSRLVAPGYQLVVVGPDGSTPAEEPLRAFLTLAFAQHSFSLALLQASCPWLFLALCGLAPCTLLAQLFAVGALNCAMCLISFCSPLASLVNFLGVALVALGYFGVSAVIEQLRRSMFLSEMLLARELHASQTADSILNHTLKNTLADVSAIIELYLAGARERTTLQDAVVCLQRGMKACRERQVYLKLVAGEYVPVLNEVRLRDFGQSLIAGRPVAESLPDVAVHLDHTLCNLILENALSNAFKHGDPHDPAVRFAVEAEPLTCSLALPHPAPAVRVAFTVSNAANPLQPPLTDDAVRVLLGGQSAEGPHPCLRTVRPLLSDRIGLSHCALAAKQGGLAVALWQAEGRVYFRVTADTVLASDTPRAALDSNLQTPTLHFPAGLTFAVLDDSDCARSLVEFHVRQWCDPSEVLCFGASEADVPLFLDVAPRQAHVIILDQQLEYSRTYLGTDLVRQLLAKGFPGLICIRSGDDAADDRAKYAESGAHCSLAKDLTGPQLAEELKRAYVRRRWGGAPQRYSFASPTRWADSNSFNLPTPNPEVPGRQFTQIFSQAAVLPLGRPALPGANCLPQLHFGRPSSR